MEAVAPQKQSIFLSLIAGYVIPIVIFIFLGRWLSKKMMKSMGSGGAGRNDVLWKKQRQGLCKIFDRY